MQPRTFHLDGLRMNAPVTAPGGVINHETIFRFTHSEDRVEAHYEGGQIVSGHLIGLISGDQFEFRYCQLHADGQLAGGYSKCILKYIDEKVHITEHYTWDNGESGKNIIAQLD